MADTSSSVVVETLAEALGAGGIVSGGDESQTLDESSSDTTTETDDIADQGFEGASDEYAVGLAETTTNLSGTNTETDTNTEYDDDWACETLGTSTIISGGSDCFTFDVLDSSGYDSTESGPEVYLLNDDTPGTTSDGSAIVDSSGSSSSLECQEFGDDLGPGGDHSGSLSYSDTASDSGGETRTRLRLPGRARI